MPGFFSRFFKADHGEPIIIVSGLPRSGTSMMMKMLEAGGAPIMTDAVRTADIDNPKGYYEYERVKDLEKETDKSYIREGRGKALKVISWLLKDLPEGNHYKILFMRRDLNEVIASQNKMLKHRNQTGLNETGTGGDDAMMADAYMSHLASVRILSRKRDDFEMIEIRYDTAVKDAKTAAQQVNAFLGGKLNEAAMAQVVDAELYRNRKGATV